VLPQVNRLWEPIDSLIPGKVYYKKFDSIEGIYADKKTTIKMVACEVKVTALVKSHDVIKVYEEVFLVGEKELFRTNIASYSLSSLARCDLRVRVYFDDLKKLLASYVQDDLADFVINIKQKYEDLMKSLQ
jgi:hypothetical protein